MGGLRKKAARKCSTNLIEAVVNQILAQMCCKIALQWLLTCNKSKTPSQLLSHQMSGSTELLFVRLCREILCDQLAGGDTRYCHGTLNDRENDLK